MTDDQFQALAETYGVNFRRRTEEEHRNRGYCAVDVELGEFDDPDCEVLAFFHEIAHMKTMELIGLERTHTLCTISDEGMAWEIGIALARKHGFKYDFYHPALNWCREQLRSYVENNDAENHTGPYIRKVNGREVR